MKGIEGVKQLSRPSCIPFFAELSTYRFISAMLESVQTPPIKWQYVTIEHITGCFIASDTLQLFCWVPMPSLGACGSYHPPHWSTGKRKQCFFPSKHWVSRATLFLHVVPTWTHNTPHSAKKEKKYRHSSCYNHSHPSRSQPLTRNGCLASRCT